MKTNISKLLLLFFLTAILFTGCKKADNDNNSVSQRIVKKIVVITNVVTQVKSVSPTPPPKETKPVSKPLKKVDTPPVLTSNVIAYINGSPVDINQFQEVFANRNLEKLPAYLRREYDKNRKNFIKQLIDNKVFEVAANDESFSGNKDFDNELADATKQVKMKYYYNKYIVSKINVTEKEEKKYYKENISKYSSPEKIRARHILVSLKKNPLPAQVTNAFNKAKLLRQRVMEGESFAEIAAAESDCPSRAKGGDLGYFQKGQMVPEFETVAFSLNKNEISGIVKTEFGYHIIQVTDKIQKRKLSFDEVKKEIKQELYSQQEKNLYNELLTILTNKYKVIKNDKVIKQLTGEL